LALIVPFCALFLGAHEPGRTAILFAYFYLRCFSNTVACDYKDLERDRSEGVRTIPMALGIGRTTRMLLTVDAVSIVLVIGGITLGGWPMWTVALPLTVLRSSVALLRLTRTWRDHEFICSVVLDSEWMVSLLLASLFWQLS
jgi:4-hydroxybenzoate polyprenyltransferase